MKYPYTPEPLDALVVTQTGVGLVLASVLWQRTLRPRPATALLLAAIAIAVLAPVGTVPFADGPVLHDLGLAVGDHFAKPALKVAAALATVATLLTRRRPLVWTAMVGEAVLWPITDYIERCDQELAAAHIAFFGLLVGVHVRTQYADGGATGSATQPGATSSTIDRVPAWVDDLVAWGAGTLVGAASCRLLLNGWNVSADEWAYTYQAALFAKLRAFGGVPPCGHSFQSYYVFQYMGRTFAQYTPGWPYFMAPLFALGIDWLAGPASLGLLVAGVCRLGRRAAQGGGGDAEVADPVTVRASGWMAAAAVLLAPMVIINGGSRYSHLFVAATFAWSVEALFATVDDALPPRAQWVWGCVLGGGAALMISTRPADGAMLGIGLLVVCVPALARRRIGGRALGAAAATFSLVGGVTLVVLRLQLGRWFATGYSITPMFHKWADFGFSVPARHLFRWGIPIAAGSYCWWPCSPAVALAGLASLRGRSRAMAMLFFSSIVPFTVFYVLGEFGRGFDWAYGPRFHLPYLVPMAVGTGVVLARLVVAAWKGSPSAPRFQTLGPGFLALAVALVCLVRVAPPIYAYAYRDVREHNWLRAALEPLHLHHAIVLAQKIAITDVLDLPENLPMGLYPDPEVLIGIDRGPDENRCVRESYPGWALYRTVMPQMQIVPFEAPPEH